MNHIELSATVPDEPPDGSVVLDCAKRAWQRTGSTWYRAAAGAPSLFGNGGGNWPRLLLDCGPVTPIWTPPPADMAVDDAGAPKSADRVEPLPDAVVVHVPPSTPANPAGFQGFTRHGHAVGGVPPEGVSWPAPVARCTGGPGCHACRFDAARLMLGRSVPSDRPGTGDPTEAAAREREERAQAEARPHDQAAQLCANCKRRPPKFPGADDPIGGHYCDPCVDRCHESTEFDHVCAICRAPEPPAEPLRAREVERPAGATADSALEVDRG